MLDEDLIKFEEVSIKSASNSESWIKIHNPTPWLSDLTS